MSEANEFTAATSRPALAVRLSRTETETLCYKATRGAGYSWGLAEEAAFAAGWLCANGIDGTAALLAALIEPTLAAPEMTPERWSNGDGAPLCPLMTGAALSDHAISVFSSSEGRLWIGPLFKPVLLLPFLAQCASALGGSIAVAFGDHEIRVGKAISADERALAAQDAASISTLELRLLPEEVEPDPAQQFAGALPLTIAALDALALRTTVPASEQSRKSGAGAGNSDND